MLGMGNQKSNQGKLEITEKIIQIPRAALSGSRIQAPGFAGGT
jgi:hypothetical protein